MAGALKHLDELAQRDVLLDRHDIGARHHHVFDPAFAQVENVGQHRPLFGREAGLHRGRLEHDFQIVAD